LATNQKEGNWRHVSYKAAETGYPLNDLCTRKRFAVFIAVIGMNVRPIVFPSIGREIIEVMPLATSSPPVASAARCFPIAQK
jgi:hypothetical protein